MVLFKKHLYRAYSIGGEFDSSWVKCMMPENYSF